MPPDHGLADERVRKGHPLIAAALGAALNPLNSTMVAVALPAISRDFGADASRVTLFVVTGYLIATLVCQMPAGSIADRADTSKMSGAMIDMVWSTVERCS